MGRRTDTCSRKLHALSPSDLDLTYYIPSRTKESSFSSECVILPFFKSENELPLVNSKSQYLFVTKHAVGLNNQKYRKRKNDSKGYRVEFLL